MSVFLALLALVVLSTLIIRWTHEAEVKNARLAKDNISVRIENRLLRRQLGLELTRDREGRAA